MILLAKIINLLLVFWLVRKVLSAFQPKQKNPQSDKQEKKSTRFDTRGKNVSDADFEEIR